MQSADTPAVSVIMSVHNGAEFLRQAVDSILMQTWEDLELLVVDDASTDNSLAILREIDDRRLRIIELSQNVGLANALNIAIETSRGGYIARMDADDIAAPSRLQCQVAAMEAHPHVVLLGTAYDHIDKRGIKFGHTQVRTENGELQAELLESNQFCHPSVMFRGETIRRTGGYRTIAGRYAQDYDLWLRLAEHGELMNLSQNLLQYRVHDGQVSISKSDQQRRSAEVYKVLARQRRSTGSEDFAAAERAVGGRETKGRLRVELLNDMIQWANNFEAQGDGAQARSLRLRVLRLAPFSPQASRLVWDWLRSRFPRSAE